ncbi:hypothetical protein L9F63_002012 [Diploptera punctata]|uniref:DNA polymerase n=1 Tax=Diploptera punctata TaxID=6984 RepID=A0AAD8A3N9_DIPPU|nr:hypothetical protein L9F63_002012 [Diploptera punctata]
MGDNEVSAGPRAKRQKVDKKGRFAALERLKQLKGSKNKYEISNIDNVYEEVDEREYTKRVLERQDDDWIVDDDCGYVEDGREIFDDDLDDDAIISATRNKKEGGVKRGRHGKKGSDNVAAEAGWNWLPCLSREDPVFRCQVPVKLDEDDILGDIMEELNSEDCRSGSKEIEDKQEIVEDTEEELNIEAPSTEESVTKSSQPIDEFDSSSMFFDDAAFQEMDLICQDAGNNKENIRDKTAQCNGDTNGPQREEQSAAPLITTEKPLSTSVKNDKIVNNTAMNWENMQGAGLSNNAVSIPDVPVDVSQLPMITNENGEKILRFYWYDAHEEFFKQPGVVFLFGKVYIESAKTYVSCCLVVKNIDRRIYLLPREKRYDMKTNSETDEDVKMMDVYQEFNDKVAVKYKIMNFKSRKIERNYAFSIPGVPVTSEYLEVLYPATQSMLPSDLQGETFSHVFGTNTSSLEQLLLSRKMKGPGWLDVKCVQPITSPMSWCKVEAAVMKPEHVTLCTVIPVPPSPPLVVVTLNMRTAVHPTNGQNEIVMLSCLVHNNFHIDKAPPQPLYQQHFCAFTRPSGTTWPYDFNTYSSRYTGTKLDKVDTERALLGLFLAKFYKMDPDLIVGHDLYGYGLELLLHRININKIPQWSKIGRLRRANIQTGKGRGTHFEKTAMCGRLVCDVKISAKELIRSRSYDLGPLFETVLHMKEGDRKEVLIDEVREMYGDSQSLITLISITMLDASLIIRLMCELNVLPLALQITNIAGNVMSRTLMGGRSERNEYLLLHAFTEKNFIVPDKQYGKKTVQAVDELDIDDMDTGHGHKKKAGSKKKPSYAGGLVLEPRKGFYEKMILLMDFNSLYPSIIQEYNICFTTINLGSVVQNTVDEEDVQVELPSPGKEPGILPTEIRKLVESRREVKKLMKTPDLSPDLKMQYNIRQMALKLTANSMYGCLGFSHSRFYAKPLAALVTAKGREILTNTKDLVEKMNFQVIYGDTDSIMINTNSVDYDQVFKIGHKIKTEVNKLYKQVELDIDGVFKYMLLLKKKKYAAVTISRLPNGKLVTQQEMKGLDIVRRDWSQLSAEAGKFILEQILSDLDPDERILRIHSHLERLKVDLEEGKVPASLLAITKQLTKKPEEYADKKSLPHVQVAMRLNEHGGRQYKQGDTVPYVICEDGTGNAATQRAYHVDELKTNEFLKIDYKYYLSQQIHPVVSRLCEHIDGTDAARIAECLGLDPSGYRHVNKGPSSEESKVGEQIILSDEEKYRNCERFKFTCKNESCKAQIVMDGPVVRVDGKISHFVLEKCSNPGCTIDPLQYLAGVQNSLTTASRSFIRQYYQNWMICEDPGCTNRTRRLPLEMKGSYPHCNMCKSAVMYREYTEFELYTQLSFFQYIFDLSKVTDKRPPSLELEKAYDKLREQAERTLRHSAYSIVNLCQLFKPLLQIKVEDQKKAVVSTSRN